MCAALTYDKLVTADRYYRDYGRRARELSEEGRQIIGYLCSYVPVEMINAAKLIPFRIIGDMNEPITKADTEMEAIVCSQVRACFDLSLKGRYSFLDGLVIPHACDSICRTYDIWKYSLGLRFNHFINTPHDTGASALTLFTNMLKTFKDSLERFLGEEIADRSLIESIEHYNQMRSKVRALYQLRKMDPPLISGSEMTRVLVAGGGIPVDEFDALLSGVIVESRARCIAQGKNLPRLMVVAAQIDSANLIELIENAGAVVVVDDVCPGTRSHFPETAVTEDPIVGLAERYLKKINCARTYRARTGSYEEYLEERFGHIGKFIEEFSVDGVILDIYRYCDPFGFEVPQMKSYIEAKGIPVLYLENEYSTSAFERLRTRIQAFLEMIG